MIPEHELEEHERLLVAFTHASQAECEVLNAMQSALNEGASADAFTHLAAALDGCQRAQKALLPTTPERDPAPADDPGGG